MKERWTIDSIVACSRREHPPKRTTGARIQCVKIALPITDEETAILHGRCRVNCLAFRSVRSELPNKPAGVRIEAVESMRSLGVEQGVRVQNVTPAKWRSASS